MIKVLVVDDSALIRKLLREIISRYHDLHVVGVAKDAFEARDLVKQHSPDVITLDIEMPRMDGLTFLAKLMAARPTPVIMISTLTEEGADATMRAMELGAVDFLPKPKIGITEGMEDYAQEIAMKIRAAAQAQLARKPKGSRPSGTPLAGNYRGTEKLIALGASTGGTEALKAVLTAMPPASPAIVITQHMPAGFTASFAQRLDSLCAIRVKEAEHGERILPGWAYLAPGGYHFEIGRSGANYQVSLNESAPVNLHRPAVDVMFNSVAGNVGGNVAAALLTGMGKDGAAGLGKLQAVGALTIAQDEETSLIYGMPKAAVDAGFADMIRPLEQIPVALVEWFQRTGMENRV